MGDPFFFVALSTLISIVDPIAAVGPFLVMTANENLARRRNTALRASLVSGGTLAVCATAGTLIFKFFGITIPALKIAGGILLFFVAFDMLNARPSRSKQTEEEQDEGVHKDDVAVFPIAIPLLSGPGAIVSVFILSEQANTLIMHVSLYGAIVLTSLAVYFTLYQAHHLQKLLGHIGMNLLMRLMGLVLAAIAIQFILDGIHVAMPALSR